MEGTYRCCKCDGPTVTKITVTAESWAEAEKKAQAAGWTKDRHRWRCPACKRA